MWEIAYYVVVIGLTIYGLTRPGPKVPDATVQTADGPTAQEGKPIPVIFGTGWVRDPNIVWYGETSTEPIESEGDGKK